MERSIAGANRVIVRGYALNSDLCAPVPFINLNKLRLLLLKHQASGGGGSQWGKMGKNGERILWGKHFRIGNFPHFSPFFPIKKKLRKTFSFL